MARNLGIQSIKFFKGLEVWGTFANSSPERATDCRNVIPSGSGGLEKMRMPAALSASVAASGPESFAQYQNADGLRQVLAQTGSSMVRFDASWNSLDIGDLPSAAVADYIEANNLMFIMNGGHGLKWDGTELTFWGIDKPLSAPSLSITTPPTPVAVTIAPDATPLNLVTPGDSCARFDGTVQYELAAAHTLAVGDLIEVAGVANASFNGVMIINNVRPVNVVEAAADGPNEASTGGAITRVTDAGIFRMGNHVFVNTTTDHGFNVGDPITIAGVTPPGSGPPLNGDAIVDEVISPTTFSFVSVGITEHSGGGTVTLRLAETYIRGGRKYRISFGNSATRHVGNASEPSEATGNLEGTIKVVVSGPGSPDAQVDEAYLWATQDGGNDYYLAQGPISLTPAVPPALGQAPVFTDTALDADLNTALTAPLINDVPPPGKYLARFGGRIFIGNLTGDPQGVVYSGYERILFGRPEESFPINNRLKLAIGADPIAGMGAVANGLVIFSRSNEMFMLRGVLQDITVTAPVQLGAFLQQLPFSQGCFSHYSIAETPHGLVWLASDKTLQLFDGTGPPQELSRAIHPLLRRITPGTENNCRACYFNFLERQWYALTVAIDGSTSNNLLLFVDLDPDPKSNVGAFPADIDAAHLDVIEDATGGRQLVGSDAGRIWEIKILSDTTSGISTPLSGTIQTLDAYWRSGIFGNESPSAMKIWRFCHVVADSDNTTDFQIQARVLKEDDHYREPDVLDFRALPADGRFSVNQKGRRIIYEIKFPVADSSANLVEFSSSFIPLSER